MDKRANHGGLFGDRVRRVTETGPQIGWHFGRQLPSHSNRALALPADETHITTIDERCRPSASPPLLQADEQMYPDPAVCVIFDVPAVSALLGRAILALPLELGRAHEAADRTVDMSGLR